MAPGDSLAIELVWSALWPLFLLRSLWRRSEVACRRGEAFRTIQPRESWPA